MLETFFWEMDCWKHNLRKQIFLDKNHLETMFSKNLKNEKNSRHLCPRNCFSEKCFPEICFLFFCFPKMCFPTMFSNISLPNTFSQKILFSGNLPSFFPRHMFPPFFFLQKVVSNLLFQEIFSRHVVLHLFRGPHQLRNSLRLFTSLRVLFRRYLASLHNYRFSETHAVLDKY